MVINFGEAQIFKWHVTQLPDGIVSGYFSASNLFKQFSK